MSPHPFVRGRRARGQRALYGVSPLGAKARDGYSTGVSPLGAKARDGYSTGATASARRHGKGIQAPGVIRFTKTFSEAKKILTSSFSMTGSVSLCR